MGGRLKARYGSNEGRLVQRGVKFAHVIPEQPLNMVTIPINPASISNNPWCIWSVHKITTPL